MYARSLAVLILLYAWDASCAGPVTIEQPILSLVPSTNHLREWCGVGGNYDACTRFVAFRLDARCVARDGQWALDATARFRPLMLIRNLEKIAHEHEHVGDVERFVAAHLESLGRETFASEESCRHRATESAAQFGLWMKEFARRSNELRH